MPYAWQLRVFGQSGFKAGVQGSLIVCVAIRLRSLVRRRRLTLPYSPQVLSTKSLHVCPAIPVETPSPFTRAPGDWARNPTLGWIWQFCVELVVIPRVTALFTERTRRFGSIHPGFCRRLDDRPTASGGATRTATRSSFSSFSRLLSARASALPTDGKNFFLTQSLCGGNGSPSNRLSRNNGWNPCQSACAPLARYSLALRAISPSDTTRSATDLFFEVMLALSVTPRGNTVLAQERFGARVWSRCSTTNAESYLMTSPRSVRDQS